MAGKIQLSPQELLAQSQEMLGLQADFDELFKQTTSILGQVNGNWSENLSNNFMGKIQSAQKAFANVSSWLAKGGELAATSANTYESMDSLLAKNIAGGAADAVRDSISKIGGIISSSAGESGSILSTIGSFLGEQWEDLKSDWRETGEFLEWANGKYQQLPSGVKGTIEKALGGTATTAISLTYDIITGNVGWDTAGDFIEEVTGSSSTAQAIVEAFKYATNGEVQKRQAAYEDAAIEQLRDGNVLAGTNTLVGSFVDTILVGATDILGDIAIGFVEDLPLVGLVEDVIGVDLSETWDTWMENAHEGVGNFIEDSTEFIAEFEEDAREFIGDVVDTAGDIIGGAVDVASDIANGAKEVASGLWDKACDAGDAIGDFFGKIF